MSSKPKAASSWKISCTASRISPRLRRCSRAAPCSRCPSITHPSPAAHALRLDFNENTFAPSPRVFAALQKLTSEGLTIYPERQPTERIVADHFGLAPEQVMLTNGVDEAIHLLACAFLDEGDEALVCTPSFFMYDVSISMMTSGLVRVQADDTLAFPFERFLAAITPRTKLIIVASPNNPTGATVSREHLLAIAAAAPQAVLMVDEAYFHFHGETTMGDAGKIAQPARRADLFESLRPRQSARRHVGRRCAAHRLSA